VKTTWHIPKPMASLSRSLAPASKPAPRPAPLVEEPLAARAPAAPPPMRRHAQGILGVLTARLPLFVWSTDSALRVTSSLGMQPAELPLPEAPGPKPELRLSDRLRPAEAEHPALTAHRRALQGEAMEFDVQGDGRTFEVHVEPFRDTAGAIEGTVGVAFDVTERRRAGTRLVHAVLHDPLTGLPNRTLFLERLRQALGRAARGGPSRVAVLLLDLDGFKAVNHQLGHDAGDRLLVDASRRIEQQLRAADTLARLDGDTFAILLQDVEHEGHAVRVARRIRENLGRPFVVAGWPRPATASVGIAVADNARARVEDILHDAEAALRRARAAGGAAEHVFDAATDIEPAPAWSPLGPQATAIDGSDRAAAPEAVLRWRPPVGQATSRLRRLARAAGLVLPPRF
jgi:diguanylate cyclase (GGDEF)-like protein